MRARDDTTFEEVNKRLRYDSLLGKLIWRDCQTMQAKWNARWANKPAGRVVSSGLRQYVVVTMNKKNYRAHRLIWLLLHGEFPVNDIDHVDGNGLNNLAENLRDVPREANIKNSALHSNNTSGCNGVFWNTARNRWQCRLKVQGKQIHGGFFCTKEEAIAKVAAMHVELGFHKNHGKSREEREATY